jgi:DNA-binding IclR family transcriptional regulator
LREPVIQSLQRGLALLEAVAERGAGLTLAEVSRSTGLHASTAFHLLRTLLRLGYLLRDGTSRQYRLGPKVFRLAAAGWGESQLSEAAEPFLADLARTTGETSHLAVFEHGEVVVIDKVDGASPVRLVERVGYPRPAHCTAIGKVLLAYAPERDLAAFLARAPFPASTPRSITTAGHLMGELREVRRRGYARDDEEFAEGVRCLAAPVWGFAGRVVAAVGISGPIWRIHPQREAELAAVVVETARRLSERLGYRPHAAVGRMEGAAPRRPRPRRRG